MATPPSPLVFLQALADRFGGQAGPLLEPASQELRRRLVLLLNHVLAQEPEACARLARQKGRVVEIGWRQWRLALAATPAGLLELAPEAAIPDLTLSLTEDSPLALAETSLRGEKPAVRISGDVMLAAEVNWLFDHVRWDLEEDLARLVGDVPAHTVAAGLRQAAQALRGLAQRLVAARAGAPSATGDAR
mgnify:CR=1 FL=1